MSARCRWCGKDRKSMSDWEQQSIKSDEYFRLCFPCARRRLNNPWNAILPMRKVGADG